MIYRKKRVTKMRVLDAQSFCGARKDEGSQGGVDAVRTLAYGYVDVDVDVLFNIGMDTTVNGVCFDWYSCFSA